MRRKLLDSYRRCTCSHIAAMHHFDPEIGSTGCRKCEECQGFMARAHKVADRAEREGEE